MRGKQRREKSYKKRRRKGDKGLRREEGLGEGKRKRAEEVTEAKERSDRRGKKDHKGDRSETKY